MEESVLEKYLEDKVALWHNDPSIHTPLKEFLNLSSEDYNLFATKPTEFYKKYKGVYFPYG